MTTSKMSGCHSSTTGNAVAVLSIMERYEQDMELSSRIAAAVKENTGERLRHLLKLILNRWGLGMKQGGALLYLNPNIEGEDVVEVDKGYDYVLGELYPELAAALWEEVNANGGTLHDYIEDIDIPQSDGADGGVHYVWIAARGEHLETVDMTASWGHEPSDVLYYGPITREFIEDVGGIDNLDADAVLDTLPKYKAGDIEWERVLDEVVVDSEPVTTHTLYYDSSSPPVRDVDIEATVSRLHHQDVHTSTGLVVEATLCHMYEGTLPPVRIVIEGKAMEFDDDGVVTYWAGYPSPDYSRRLLLAALGKWNTKGS